MNIISLTIILFSYIGNDSSNVKIESVFEEFQIALIKGDCEKVAELSNFPIEGDMGLARLLNTDEPREQMEKLNFQISKKILIQNCSFLDSIEIVVLSRFDIKKKNQKMRVALNDCIYTSGIYIGEDKSYFQWSVGCSELINRSIGEYSIIFTFKLIDGEYKLKRIHGAG